MVSMQEIKDAVDTARQQQSKVKLTFSDNRRAQGLLYLMKLERKGWIRVDDLDGTSLKAVCGGDEWDGVITITLLKHQDSFSAILSTWPESILQNIQAV